jgi:hypothetical protein
MGNKKADRITNEMKPPTSKNIFKTHPQPFFHQEFLPILNIRDYLTKKRNKQIEKKTEIKNILQKTKCLETPLRKAKLWFPLTLQGFAYKLITNKLPTRIRNRNLTNAILSKRKKEEIRMTCPLCGVKENILLEEEMADHFLKCKQKLAGEKAINLSPYEWITKLEEKKLKSATKPELK